MARARLAAYAALMVVLLLGVAALPPPPRFVPMAAAAAVGWPPSEGLVIAEVVTGGTSASDEYVELANAGTAPIDLAGLEVAYATASGATVTRKAAWSLSLLVAPGRHVLIANALGVFAPGADATYSGGLAATGGAIVLRPAGGTSIDAVGWGDAVGTFVEGTAAPAPAAGRSIERIGPDSNDNAMDFVVNEAPVPQGLGWDPGPIPSSSPNPSSIPSPDPTPPPSATPTPTPSLVPAPSPTSTPQPSTPIAAVRGLSDGSTALVEGVLTTGLGALESGRTGFIQDATAGIAIYLDVLLVTPLPAGTSVRLAGTLDSRYAQRTLRVAALDVAILGSSPVPDPLAVVTGAAGEPVEGLRVTLTGTVVEAPSALSDGLGLLVDDGTGPVRVIAAPAALDGANPRTGDLVTATGPLGQRDSSGTGLAGYRLFATMPGELVLAPPPSPSPSPSPSPTQAATPSPVPTATPVQTSSPRPSASPAPTPTPAATPTPSAVPLTVVAARLVPEGKAAVVRGVVIAEAGRLGTPPLFAIGDATAGLPVRLRDDQAAPARGTLVELRGVIAAPYGQTELRLSAGGLTTVGAGAIPAPLAIEPGAAGEVTEGRLAQTAGTITAGATKATSGDIALTIEGSDGVSLRVLADASARLDTAVLRKGASVTLTGVLGQRASRKGALDGYRLWVRDPADLMVRAATASPSTSGSPTASPATLPLLTIAKARLLEGKRVTVEGTVTIDRTLLDASGRRAIVEDASAAIEIYLDGEMPSIRTGVRVRVSGTVGRAWGAPRLRVEAIRVLGQRVPVVHDLRVAPGAATEWRLVRVRGTVAELHRSGDRWTAELVTGSVRIPLVGLPGSGIAASAMIEGRSATVTGIVKRPYPTATDQRFAVVPRTRADLDLGLAASATGSAAPAGAAGVASGGGGPASATGAAADRARPGNDIPLARLAERIGTTVRVGGLVTGLGPDGVRLDDGTAVARIVLEGAAADLVALLQPGDALNASGTPEVRDDVVLVVTDPAGVVLLGDLGQDVAAEPPADALAILGGLDGEDGPRVGPGAAVSASLAAGRGADPVSLALATVLLTAAIGAGVAASRVSRTRRLARARIQARLDAIAATPPGPAGPPAAA